MRFAEIVGPGRAEARVGPPARLAVVGPHAVGDWVGLDERGAVGEVLGRAGSARAALHAVAAALGLDPYFPPAVRAETEAHLRRPDFGLPDLRHQPFVTIDGPHSRDLDQALFIEREGGGYLVHYALADAGHYAPRGSALFDEALARGASFYFPGFALPMLPRPLSEDLVSLNEGVPRRALIFRVRLDHRGERLGTSVSRGLVESRRKLHWAEVQALYDGDPGSPLRGTEHELSLRLLAELGERLLDREASRDLVRFHREELDVALDAEGLSFVVRRAVRARVELYNEQISLLVNGEGARLLREHPSLDVEPIYRLHPAPDPERLEALRASIEAIARHHRLPDTFVWQRGASLARYIVSLPAAEGAPDRPLRIARAIERQAIVSNLRSYYAADAGPHHGVGLDPYGRFTAPMREIVGIFLHQELAEAFGLAAQSGSRDGALREAVVEAGNRSREIQRRVSDAGNRLVIDRLLRADLALPAASRPPRRATVMGLSRNKVHVALDDPPLDLKLYLRELGRVLGGVWLEPSEDGVSLREQRSGRVVFSVGDALDLETLALDAGTDRWVLRPRRVEA
jgi:ribonuclease R